MPGKSTHLRGLTGAEGLWHRAEVLKNSHLSRNVHVPSPSRFKSDTIRQLAIFISEYQSWFPSHLGQNQITLSTGISSIPIYSDVEPFKLFGVASGLGGVWGTFGAISCHSESHGSHRARRVLPSLYPRLILLCGMRVGGESISGINRMPRAHLHGVHLKYLGSTRVKAVGWASSQNL